MFCTFFTGFLCQYIFPGWEPRVFYYVLGAVISPTDTASVTAAMKTAGASSRLTMLVVGESLMNDAAAILLFGITFSLGTGDLVQSGTAFWNSLCTRMAFDLIVSPLYGVAVGLLAVGLMHLAYKALRIKSINVQVVISVLAAFTSFVYAQLDSKTFLSNMLPGSGGTKHVTSHHHGQLACQEPQIFAVKFYQ